MFGGQNIVVCCVESERDPVHIASLEEKEFFRQVSLLSEINQQLKQEFGRFAMNRSRHVHDIARDTKLFWPSPDKISLFC